MRVSLACALLALSTIPACAAENGEDVASEDAALEADFGEIDDDAIPLRDDDYDVAATLADDDEHVLPAVKADETDDDASTAPLASATFERPSYCNPDTSLDLLVYYEVYAQMLYTSLGKHTSGCSQYWVAIPKVAASAGKSDANLFPRQLHAKNVHDFGKAFRATAEFHWGSTTDSAGLKHPGWKTVEVVKTGKAQYETKEIPRARYFRTGWYAKGVLFRQRMAKAGYLTQTGDTWHINELESAWARSPAYLKAIRDVVRGLSDGDPEYDAFADADPAIEAKTDEEKRAINVSAHKSGVRGVVYLATLGRRLPGETSDDAWTNAVKLTLRRKKFWADMASYVEYWGQERYLGAPTYCVAGRSLDDQTTAMQRFQESLPELALRAPRYKGEGRAGQSTVATALFYLSHRYTPVVSAAWTDPKTTEKKMGDFVAGQVYSVRRFANDNAFPDGRVGVYFRPRQTDALSAADDAANATFADRIATSINGAYDGRDGSASGACGPTGAAGCRCGD